MIPNSTTTKPPDWLYRMKFNPETQEWYESATPEEITAILAKGRNAEPSESQLLGQQITDLEISDIIQGQQRTDQEIALIIQGQQITDLEISNFAKEQRIKVLEDKILIMEANQNV